LKDEYGKYSRREKNTKKEKGVEKNFNFKDGQRVHHETFGGGIIISSEEDIVTIAFMKAGVKKISAKFADLKKI
jgi:transcription elongation factor GreA-like protein